MIILAIVNNKGGVSKTTTAINVAASFAREGKVLLIDLDSQANCTLSTVGKEARSNVGEWLTGSKPFREVVVNFTNNLDVLPSARSLDVFSKVIGAEDDYQFKLKDKIEQDGLGKLYDYIVIDNAPSLTTLVYCSLVAATHLLIPTLPDYLAYNGIDNILQTVQNIKKRYNKNLKVVGIFFTKYAPTYRKKLQHDMVEAARETFSNLVMNTYIRENISLSEAQVMKQPIFDYASESNGAFDYGLLYQEIKTRL